jgi:hypothetical protein
MNDKKVFVPLAIAASIVSLLFVLLLANKYLVEHVKNQVIQELRRDYVPGPYDPGFDPDKVNPNFRKSSVSKAIVIPSQE